MPIRVNLITAETKDQRFSEGHESIYEALLHAKKLKHGVVKVTFEEDNELWDFYLDAAQFKRSQAH